MDFICNGLLPRGDLHTLFDLDLIGVNPRTFALAGKAISLPKDKDKGPNLAALERRWREFRNGR